MSGAAPATTRFGGLDALKGIAIVLVVAIHAAPIAAPGAPGALSWERHVISGIARLAVPLFLLISGFLVGSRQPPHATLVGYFWKFLGLHLLYSAFYWALEPLGIGSVRPLTLKNALMHFAAFAYPGQYFLFVLPQIYFLLAFVVPERLRTSTGLLLASLLLTAGCIAFLAASVASGSSAPLPWAVAGQAEATVLPWLFAFSVGIWVGARSDPPQLSRIGAAPSLLLAATALGLAAFDLPATNGPDFVNQFAYARWSPLLGTALLAAALPWASRNLRFAPLEALGRESFGIFVFNPVLLGVLRIAGGGITTLARSWLYLAATLVIAYGLTRLLRKRIPFAFP